MSIYDLDPKIRRLLSLDNFLDNLTVYEFIEELGKGHSAKNQQAGIGHFDPKPFIRTFESTLRELKQLSTEAAVRQSALEKEVNKFELDHSRNILSLTKRAESVNGQFKKLDDQISAVSSTINPITENLSSTTSAKDRSIATIGLIQIYNDFYKTGSSRELQRLVTGTIKQKKKCASTVAQLLSLSLKLISDDLQNSKNCHDIIQKFSETMENSLLEEFDEEYKASNLDKMKEIADILTDYNGGTAVIKNFVNQHNFFLSSETFLNGEDLNDEATWDKLSDPSNHHSLSESFSSEFYNKISEVLKDETIVIIEVFRDPVAVLELFIQRIFAQQIQSRIEALLKNSYSTSTLAYLRTLYSLYTATGNFTKDLTQFFQSSLGSEDYKLDDLNAVLDQSYSDLFTQHLSDSRYIELEKKSLESIFLSITSAYERSNEAKITNKLTARITNAANETGNEYEQLNRRSRVGQLRSYVKHRLDRTGSLKRTNSSASFDDSAEKEQVSAKLDLHYVDSLLKSTVESLSRQIELTPNKTAEFGYDLLEILLIGIGKTYVDLGLEVSYSDLRRQDYGSDYIDFEYLHNVNVASEILYLVSTCIRTIILPLANNNPQIRTRIISLTNSYIGRVELAINILIKDTLGLAFDRVSSSLSKQKKKDYMAADLSETDTPACVSLCAILGDFNEQIRKYLNGENLTRLLRELGNHVFTQLFEHYKNFQINSTGGIVVTKDIISYQTTIEEWKIPELSANFQLLREIANLFTVQPELLNSLTKEGRLATVKPYILRQFISKRSDYNTNRNYLDKLRGII